MKIISWNVNGLRSVFRKSLFDFLEQEKPDLFCLQEIKASLVDLPAALVNPLGYLPFYNPAVKKGYSGTAVYSRIHPVKLLKKIGYPRFDQDGRFIFLKFPNFSLVNLYLPHGGRQKENFAYKFASYRTLLKMLKKQKPDIVIGDFNIAHTELDLANPRGNRNNTMFTVKERQQIDNLIGLGYRDSFRMFNQRGDNFTWWPYRNRLRQRNIGWRIDYAFVAAKIAAKIKKAVILKKVMGSDHCPIGIEI